MSCNKFITSNAYHITYVVSYTFVHLWEGLYFQTHVTSLTRVRVIDTHVCVCLFYDVYRKRRNIGGTFNLAIEHEIAKLKTANICAPTCH